MPEEELDELTVPMMGSAHLFTPGESAMAKGLDVLALRVECWNLAVRLAESAGVGKLSMHYELHRIKTGEGKIRDENRDKVLAFYQFIADGIFDRLTAGMDEPESPGSPKGSVGF